LRRQPPALREQQQVPEQRPEPEQQRLPWARQQQGRVPARVPVPERQREQVREPLFSALLCRKRRVRGLPGQP